MASFSALAQNEFKSDRRTYFESNFGFAYIVELESPFPGCSFLIGNRKFTTETIFFDSQIGLALPTIGTAKVGIGKYNLEKETANTIGVRIWPTHLYIQHSRATDRCSKKVSKATLYRLKRKGKTRNNILCGEWNFSIEVGVHQAEKRYLGDGEYEWVYQYEFLSASSFAILNVGYRVYF